MNCLAPDSTDDSPRPAIGLFLALYVVAILTTSIVLFGLTGILVGVLVSLFWASVFLSRSRPRALGRAILLYAAGAVVCLMFIPATRRARETQRPVSCSNQVKHIALAFHNYHDVHSCFPPAFVSNEDGSLKHSWRILVLPYLEQQELYDKYDFDEPWNGENNRKLLDDMPSVFACPYSENMSEAQSRYTSYVVVTGEHTLFSGEPTSFQDVTDGTSKTALFVEYEGADILWMEPKDLDFDQALAVLSSRDRDLLPNRHKRQDFFFSYATGNHMATADGTAWVMGNRVDRNTLDCMLQIDDGNDWSSEALDPSRYHRRPRVGNWVGLGLLIVLGLLPLLRVSDRS